MKTVILAIAFLAATVTAADVCQLQCTSQNGSWSGNSSVIIDLGGGIEIAYDVEYELVVVVNTNINIAIAANGNFIVILNIQTGGAVIIDIKTQYAVYVSITVNFKNSDGSINYSELVAQIEILISRYSSITSSTSGSFNFSLIIIAYYSFQFDLSVIIVGNAQLVQQLEASFGVVFALLQQAIISGSLSAAEGIWGFFVVVIDIEIRVSLLIVEVFRLSVQYYQRIQVELIVVLVERLSIGISALEQFTIILSDYLSVAINASISAVISYVDDVRNNPVNLNITIGSSSYALVVTNIDGVYVIRLSIQSSSGSNLDIKLVLVGDVLFIYNLNTNIAVALYRNYFVALNVTSDLAIVAKWSFLGALSGNLIVDATLQQDILNQRYSKIEADIKAIVNQYQSNGAFNVVSLWQAVLSGSVQRVAAVVGSANASKVLALYGGFFGQCTGSSVGGIVVGVFGNKRVVFVLWFAGIIDVTAKGGGIISWSSVIRGALKISGGVSGGVSGGGGGGVIGGGGGGGGGSISLQRSRGGKGNDKRHHH